MENKSLKRGEIFKIELLSRGALGLQLLVKMDNDSIVDVKRVEPVIDPLQPPRAGDSIGAFFEVTALNTGHVQLIFYETQPWNKDFMEITQKVINIVVTE